MTRAVAITTSADAGERPARELRRVGLEPVALPCIEVEERPGAVERVRRALPGADLIAVTSTRILDFVWGSGPLANIDFAAVGRATAREIERRGGRVAATGRGGALELAGLIAGELPRRHVLYLHARDSDPAAIAMLAPAAATFAAVEVYQSVPVGPGDYPVDAVMFASPSAVTGWLLTRTLDDMVAAAIGATTAAELARQARPPEVVAPDPSFESLADALAAHFEEAA